MVSYTWPPLKLDEHYQKHPCSTAEYPCWQKLTAATRSPISKNQYENESTSVISNAWLIIDAGHQEKSYSDIAMVRNFYDRRACFSAVSRDPRDLGRIRTCFHIHLDNVCDISDSLRRKLLLLEKLIDKRNVSQGRLVSPKVVKHYEQPSERPRLAKLFGMLVQPRRTGSRR